VWITTETRNGLGHRRRFGSEVGKCVDKWLGKVYRKETTRKITKEHGPSLDCIANYCLIDGVFVLESTQRVMLVPQKGYFARDSVSDTVCLVKETLVFLDRARRTPLKAKLVIDPGEDLAV
jgi:hypothetical protein